MKLLLIPILFGTSLFASVVQVSYINAPTGANDGTYYVLPYAITVNGVATSAICYDIFDDIAGSQTWYANELTVAEAATSGFFGAIPNALSLYREIGWLSVQSYANAAAQVDLQHNIWNVFGGSQTYVVNQGPGSYSAALATAQASGYAGFDFSTVAFLVPVDGIAGDASGQAFVIGTTSTTTSVAAQTPEPGTIAMLGGGLMAMAIGSRRRKANRS